MPHTVDQFKPGQRIIVTQQIPQARKVWSSRLVGTVVSSQQQATGSWFAHGKNDRLWLDRLEIKKDDGEIVVCSLDEFTHVELLAEPPKPPAAPSEPVATP